MCEVCDHIITYATASQYDPTKTLTLRNAFVRDMNARFNRLVRLVKKAILEQDVFGLKDDDLTVQTNLPGRRAFAFTTTSAKVDGFMQWLRTQVDRELLTTGLFSQVGQGISSAWTNTYIEDSYRRGIQRARYEMKKAGFNVPPLSETGGIEGAMQIPVHADRLGILYTRAFDELKGITSAMDNQISKVLAQGLADGVNPNVLASRLVKTMTGVGDLSMTDTLGRFIPAKRRAQTLARTEIIRAHHMATVQEYKNWAVEGVTVIAEWATAGDDRVCDECAGMHGNRYSLKEIEYMIPRHPNCFIDPQTPIYTSEGWIPIGKIKVGDLVLTHKHRFRKVTELIRTPKQQPKVVKFKFKGNLFLSMTEEHPVQVMDRNGNLSWKLAKDVTKEDRLMVLASLCKRCETPVPYFRSYCSRTCLSLDITDKQWASEEHRKNISEKATKQLHREYKTGIRDRNSITKEANKKVKELSKQGKFILQQDAIRDKIREVTNTPELNKRQSERMKKKNPMHDPITVQKVQDSLQDLYKNHPEKRLNMRMARFRKSGRKTDIEQKVADVLDHIGIDYVFQYPILRYNVDFAIPDLAIVIECDGEYWHKDKKYDAERQQKIEDEGWLVLRYTGTKIYNEIDKIEKELSRVLSNHLGDYGSIPIEIENIKSWTIKRARTLYNFSVEEDESYIAKGITVHNCRCIAIPVMSETKQN